MDKQPQAIVFWSIWISLTLFYFLLPIRVGEGIPFSFEIREFEWNWMVSFSMLNVPFILLARYLSEKWKADRKKLLPAYVSGLAIANAQSMYAVFLVQPGNPSTESVIWFIGLFGMLLFFPAPLMKLPNQSL